MEKLVIGYIFCDKNLGKDEKIFLKLAKKINIELLMINISKDIDEIELEKKLKNCKVVYNNSAEEFAVEYAKTLEEWGKKVIDSSQTYYYTEDKWMFFTKCLENNIPTPETILLSEDINNLKKELKKFNHWPIILKRVYGTTGDFVCKAENLKQTEEIINNFWKKGSTRLPVIAQEFIASPSYRVTVIDGKILQTVIKENRCWKATGVYTKKFKKFKVDKDLKNLIKKIIDIVKIKICGIDFLKKNSKWLVLEVNADPAFDFFENEREKLIEQVLKLLKKEANKL